MANDRKAVIRDFVERTHQVLDDVDYYSLLSVPVGTGPDEVRDSYYKLAASLHPDIHGTDVGLEYRRKLTSVFSRVAEAYKVLSDSTLRERYDRELEQGQVRIGMGADIDKKKHDVSDSSALRFYELGKTALGDGDFKSALMNLRFAEQKDPKSESIKSALAAAKRGQP